VATFTVTTAADVVNAGDRVLSLREAVAQANATTAADTIVFAGALEGSTLVLTGGELVVNQDLRIDGDPGQRRHRDRAQWRRHEPHYQPPPVLPEAGKVGGLSRSMSG
jgi:hypothetical protein